MNKLCNTILQLCLCHDVILSNLVYTEFLFSRCWQCATDMTGKIPFQYFDYKFCSTKCLQTHRKEDKS